MNLTPYQIAEAFPDESKEFIPKVLPVLKSKLLAYREQIKRIERMPISKETKGIYFLFANAMAPENIRERINLYEKTMDILKNKTIKDAPQDIVLAKSKPIETLHAFQRINQGTFRIQASCPFHGEDKHPSFVIYKGTNSFHCFTCKVSGDAIEFFMKLNNVNFKEAVSQLSK